MDTEEVTDRNFHQLIAHAPDAVIVIDNESRIVIWNPKCEQLFGWTYQEVEGKLLGNTIIPEQYREAHMNGMNRFLTTGEIRVLNKTIEITAIDKSAKEFFVALTISKSELNGEIVFIAFIRDISEQKKMEAALRLQQEQLLKNNEELEQYASLASHDLKEPIRKILIFCDLLIGQHSEGDKEKQLEILRKIESSAVRMQSLIRSIGHFSSLALQRPESVQVSLNEIISEVIRDLEDQIRNKDAQVEISVLGNVFANRLQVYQLFENLFTNALKFSRPAAAPSITITADHEKDGFIFLHFADNGIGFSNQYAEKVFQPFQRLHGSSYIGTGIGLAICKKIIEAHGGDIYVYSEPGKGTTFTFSLPTHIFAAKAPSL